MTQPSLRWCPHCREPKLHASALNLKDHFEPVEDDAAPGDPLAQRRRWYCTECTRVWDSWELPVEFIRELLAARDQLEKAERQTALLRVLLAKERGAPLDETMETLARVA